MKNDFIKSIKHRRLKFVKDYHIRPKSQIFVKIINNHFESSRR